MLKGGECFNDRDFIVHKITWRRTTPAQLNRLEFHWFLTEGCSLYPYHICSTFYCTHSLNSILDLCNLKRSALRNQNGWGAGAWQLSIMDMIRVLSEVAIKFLPPGSSADPQFRVRFEREAESSQLEHPSIVPVYDVGEEIWPYFVMRYIGEFTFERIRRRCVHY